ncbi:hypothetical protein M2399_002582 [Pseudomonas sp. BIGb0450]|uniref:hypothetical protein n=1 Tax=unclassified Pseudomonas TaxID=196821 RepID=UPI00216A882F|nr:MULTISPECIES: hypothetical protein [unclassified Pseudomonas]MCS3417148.1 hypothetical protein [Pseudomonas sp. BIGb0558]MCS3437145.1 hypothetical protein [Pseudomonas sp. BIGb0450]
MNKEKMNVVKEYLERQLNYANNEQESLELFFVDTLYVSTKDDAKNEILYEQCLLKIKAIELLLNELDA